MPDEEMIERLALILEQFVIGMNESRTAVKLLVKAMREPTEKMKKHEGVCDKCYYCGGHIEGWQLMIDAVLK